MAITNASSTVYAFVEGSGVPRDVRPCNIAPARVFAAMDPDPVTNLRVGYRRNEMWSESLVGTVKRHDCHAFLVHGDAVEWPGKEFEPTPVHGDQN